MDASLSSTRSVEMCRIEASRRMVTAWVADMCVITPLAMPSSLSHFPGEGMSKINGGASVPHGGAHSAPSSMLMRALEMSALTEPSFFDIDAVARTFMWQARSVSVASRSVAWKPPVLVTQQAENGQQLPLCEWVLAETAAVAREAPPWRLAGRCGQTAGVRLRPSHLLPP